VGRKSGFSSDGVLTFRITLPEAKYATEPQQRTFTDKVLNGIRTLPGVRSVGSVTFLPLSGWYGVRTFTISGRAAENLATSPPVVWSPASPDYFHTMEIATLRGRTFTEQDSTGGQPVAVVSQSLAQQHWENKNPLGEQITLQYEKTPRTVVGVVGDVRHFGASTDATAQVYVPYRQALASLMCFVVRTSLSNPLNLANGVQRVVWSVDKDQPLSYVMSMDQLASESIAPQRVLMVLLAGFAGLALALAAVGVYGVMTNSVVERTREIGIRMAMGAGRHEVLWLVIARGMALTLAGVAVGAAGAWALTRFLTTMLYGVRPTDPTTFAVVSVALTATAFVASYIPAYRATKVDPMVALRYE